MKNTLQALCLILVVNLPLFAQDSGYGLEDTEHLLDGYSFNYQYQSGRAIHILFKDGELTYQWIAGANAGNPIKTLPYQSRKIDDSIYLVNWHEPLEENFITLVINLKNRIVASSVIVKYGRENPVIAFEGGIIEHVNRE